MVHTEDPYALERNEDNQPVAKNIVVQRAQDLGRKKRGEPALSEKRELVGS